MDTGNFRPIGEEAEMISSNVRLLFATTETPEEALLPTFYRRISVIVELPTFHERPIFERIELVRYLFEREAKRIKKNIVVSNDNFFALTTQELSGNIGSLSNQVRMSCADALRLTPHSQTLFIGQDKKTTVKITYPSTSSPSIEEYQIFAERLMPILDINEFAELKEKLQNVDILKAVENKYTERFLFFFFPRQRISYEVELSVTVAVTEIKLADISFSQQMTEDPNGIAIPFVTKKI